MKLVAYSLFVGTAAVLLSLSARAEDVVAIRYLDGYPPVNVSTEWINLRVARHSVPKPVGPAPKKDIDRYFEQVAAVLKAHRVSGDWQLAIPDAPAIEISVEMDGRKLMLVSCHVTLERSGNYLVTERGGRAVPDREQAAEIAKQSEHYRNHRAAFEKILALTLERTRAQLAP